MDSWHNIIVILDKEDAYTVMNSAGTLIHSSLSGGWNEQEPVAEKKLTLCLQST